MTRLTNDLRRVILKRIFEHAFMARDAAMEVEERAVARKVYEHEHPAKIRAAMAVLPQGFLYETDCIDVRIDGQSRRLNLGGTYPVGRAIAHGYVALASSEPIGAEVKAFHVKKAAYEDEKEKRKREARTIVSAASSVKRLIETWPAVESLVADLKGEKAVTALALPMRDLNAALGLPPDSDKNPAKKKVA